MDHAGVDALAPSISGKRLARVEAVPDQLAFLYVSPATPDDRCRNGQVSWDDTKL